MVIALENQRILLRRERAVEFRELLESRNCRLHQERQQRHAVALVTRLRVELLAVGVQVGNVGLVVLGDVRHVEPGPLEVGARDPLDARQGLALDGAELRKVLGRDLGDTRRGGGRSWRRCRGRTAQKGLDVVFGDAAFLAGAANLAEVDPELARQSAHARAGVHLVDAGRGAVGARTAAGDGGGARRDGRR